MIPRAALAVVRAAVEDAQREHDDQAEAVVARIVTELRDQGWTIIAAPPEQDRSAAA
ncbi:hypothetical protein ACFOOM_09960 [Streptomyces echinoruber]|uniref:Uncharacterized protein n=1 Tax=Streptomyces echinoruber TaxID=68898 RepID=A0A918S470_9ACTN|nr:hypothetical protein [Streptomyces echinoruber]GHA19758.1 hypothetical protein GCM10010389_66530 [Streptomyces echinoruber]